MSTNIIPFRREALQPVAGKPFPLSPKEVAARLGVSERTAARLMSEGMIESFRVGIKLLRCRPEAVDAYLARPFARYRRAPHAA